MGMNVFFNQFPTPGWLAGSAALDSKIQYQAIGLGRDPTPSSNLTPHKGFELLPKMRGTWSREEI